MSQTKTKRPGTRDQIEKTRDSHAREEGGGGGVNDFDLLLSELFETHWQFQSREKGKRRSCALAEIVSNIQRKRRRWKIE